MLELKLVNTFSKSILTFSYNRTMLELKQTRDNPDSATPLTYNRTMLELKPYTSWRYRFKNRFLIIVQCLN